MKKILAAALVLSAALAFAGSRNLTSVPVAVDDGSAELVQFCGYPARPRDGGFCVDLQVTMRAALPDGGTGDYLTPPRNPDRCCGPTANMRQVINTCFGDYLGVTGVDGGGP